MSPTSPTKPFLMPKVPVRATQATQVQSSTTATITTTTSQSVAFSQDADDGIVIYTKPLQMASQIMPTQTTQLADGFNGFELEEEAGDENEWPSKFFATMRGHGTTLDVDLLRDKSLYTFGTSKDCDVIIPHSHWFKILGNRDRLNERWFELHTTSNSNSSDTISVYIKDVSVSGVYLNGKMLQRNRRKLLNWGDVVTGGAIGGRELFQYSYRSNDSQRSIVKTIQGEVSSYEVEDQPFASGMYSQVYAAKDIKTGGKVACKIIDRLRRELNAQEQECIAFEIEILRAYRHENIIHFVDIFQETYKTYIFTEYIDGVTLSDFYQEQDNNFGEIESRAIFQQLCAALTFLHSKDVVHRDIKSENVMITEPGTTVKLIDFGLARIMSNDKPLVTICGTRAYMAPETAMNNEINAYGPAVDIWALGVILFRMLVGCYPFDGETHRGDEEEAVHQLVDKQDLSKENLGAQYQLNWRPLVDKQAVRTPEVKDLLQKLLDADPTKRLRANQVELQDWMEMTDEDIERFERQHVPKHEGSTEIMSKASSVSSAEEPWGALLVVPGSIRSAPKRIDLVKSLTVLGSGPFDKEVDFRVVKDRGLSPKQCLIQHAADGSVMMHDYSPSGTYLNNMRVGKGMLAEVYPGDILGLIVPPDNPEDVMAPKNWNRRFLKYKVVVHGAIERPFLDTAKRKYEAWATKPGEQPDADAEAIFNVNPIWGLLVPLNGESEHEELRAPMTKFGRDKTCAVTFDSQYVSRLHCIIYWENMVVYIENHSSNGTYVNGQNIGFERRYQLRHDDKIQLVHQTSRPKRDLEGIQVGYTLKLVGPAVDKLPRMKKLKHACPLVE